MSEAEKPKKGTSTTTVDDLGRDFSASSESRESHTDSWRVRPELPTPGDSIEDSGRETDSDDLVGRIVAERYLVERLLGSGGMGAVYAAQHTQLKKLVALKILHGAMSSNEEVVARFEREAVAAGRLVHPGIVAATDFGRLEDGSFYLALEFVDGQSLAELLDDEKTLSPARAVGIAIQINDALCAAHGEDIVHRDMKPENVMLVRGEDGEDYVKVVDFGIAKIRLDEEHQEGLTRAGLVFGTPEYMSPEQAMGNEADARSDLYGVGMLLYEMLAGSSPFREEDVTAMLTAQIKQPPPPLSEDIPSEVRDVVMRLLSKDPDERPQSADELAEELFQIAEGLGWALPSPRTSTGTRTDRRRQPSNPPRARQGSTPFRSKLGSTRTRSTPPASGPKKRSMLLPVLGLGVGVVIGAAAMLTNTEVVPTEEMREKAERIDAEAQLIADASAGDRDAISELRRLTTSKQRELEEAGLITVSEKRADHASSSDRNEEASVGEKGETPRAAGATEERPLVVSPQADERVAEQANRYMVLGRGYSVIKHFSAAVEMYRLAVRLDPHLSQDTELLLDIRSAIAARDAVDDALDFALHALGSHGADLIFDVYLDHLGEAGMTPVVARAMRIAKSDELMEQATPELQIALRLQSAKYCAQYRDIIPDAAKYADERSLQKLKALQHTRGCGTDGKNDCFICLRRDDVPLDEAIVRSESHPSPGFLEEDAPSP